MNHRLTLCLASLFLAACPEAPPPEDAPTWYQDVQPIVVGHCAACHEPGGVGGVELTDYQSARQWADVMASEAEARTMPPWHAVSTEECTRSRPWKDDVRLSDEQIATLSAWAAAEGPEGDAATATSLPETPMLDLEGVTDSIYPEFSWESGGDSDQYQCFTIDPGLSETNYLTGFQVVPDNLAVVHHVLFYLDEQGASETLADDRGTYECFGGPGVDGALVGVWAPGMPAQEFPEGSGFEIPGGSRFVMQVHYSPRGAVAQEDHTGVDLRLQSTPTPRRALVSLRGNGTGLQPGPGDEGGVEFRIPAGSTDHTETMRISLPDGFPDLTLWGAGTHMHLLGVDMTVEVERASPVGDEPVRECLVQTPAWDFNWQRLYNYDVPVEELPVVRGGDTLVLECTYNNSLSNPFLAEELRNQGAEDPVDVLLGESTLEEMCLAVLGVMY